MADQAQPVVYREGTRGHLDPVPVPTWEQFQALADRVAELGQKLEQVRQDAEPVFLAGAHDG